MDGIKGPSTITLGLVLLDLWMYFCILADMIQDVIDEPVVYCVLDCSNVCLLKKLILLWGQV